MYRIHLRKEGDLFLVVKIALWVWKSLKVNVSSGSLLLFRQLEAEWAASVYLAKHPHPAPEIHTILPVDHTARSVANDFLLCLMEQAE